MRPSFPTLRLTLPLALLAVPLAPFTFQAPVAAQEEEATAWRTLDPDRTLYMELPGGRVVMELAPEFAPEHVANIRTLVRERYFDGLAVLRAQDNYVVQWGDPEGDRSLGSARTSLPAELDRPVSADLPFTALPDGDVYAPQVGFTLGFPVARDPAEGRDWLVHCYGAVGVARGNDPEAGSGAQLYVVIGHAPRHLDRNGTIVGRVVRGMEVLSTAPRGSGRLGFYQDPETPIPIRSVRLGGELPAEERSPLQVMRTDSEAFRSHVEARRTRDEDWFVHATGRVEVCNVGVPTRTPEG